MDSHVQPETLIGEVLTSIDIDEREQKILLTTASGRLVMIHHYQECCESVEICGTDGAWRTLVGKPIESVSVDEVDCDHEDDADSRTRTNIAFRVDGATVISRWVGDSNGYYSESVDIKEVGRRSSN